MQNRALLFTKIQAVLFLLFLMITFLFNRFAIDDYYFIAEVSTKNFFDAYADLYLNWHGRWSSNFFLLFLIQGFKIPFFLFGVNMVSFVLVYSGINQLFKIVNIKHQLGFTTIQTRWYGIIAMSVFFFSNPNPSETWFWYTASVVYYWSIAAAVWVINSIYSETTSWPNNILFVLGLLFIGGANEPLTFVLFAFFGFLIYKRYKPRKLLAGLALLLTSFLINYLSRGTMHRDEITPALSLLDSFLYAGFATVNYLFYDFHTSFQIAILLAVPFYILGKQADATIGFNPTKGLVIGLFLIGLTTFFNAFMGTYALGGLPPDRSMITSSLVIAGVICWLAFGLGNYSKSTKKVVYYVPLWGCVYLLLFNVYYFSVHQEYAEAVDHRIKMIKTSTDKKVLLDALPHSGYVYSAEITDDVNHFKNQHLKKGLGIEQDVVLKVSSE